MRSLQDIYDQQSKNIEKYGFTVQAVFSDGVNPGFAYTIGLTKYGQPELLVFGLPAQAAMHFLNGIVESSNFAPLSLGEDAVIDDLANLPMGLRIISQAEAGRYCFQVHHRYGKERPTFMQVVLSDQHGRMPWDALYDKAYMAKMQPELWHAPVDKRLVHLVAETWKSDPPTKQNKLGNSH